MRIRDGNQPWSKAGKILSHNINRDGHHRVTLFRDGTRIAQFVHRLVCAAWHGPHPKGKPLALHADDNKNNNTPENLYWGDVKENGADSHRNGKSVRGERVNTAKLSEEQVVQIRIRAFHGETNMSLAREFGIPDSGISSIVRGRNWKHAGGPIITETRRGRPGMKFPATNDNGIATQDAA